MKESEKNHIDEWLKSEIKKGINIIEIFIFIVSANF